MLLKTYEYLFESIFGYAPVVKQIPDFYSHALMRQVHVDIYMPQLYRFFPMSRYPLLLVNDGQDLPVMHFSQILTDLYREKSIKPILVVGIHANQDRMREYGVCRQPDYKGRGDKAERYSEFILTELFPLLFKHLRLSGKIKETAYAGFSLGGLSALDIAWANPHIFGKVGVFSGALWWRWAPVQGMADPDSARIMHDIIRSAPSKNASQRFWFQTGTLDEEEDRNQNGIIDAIDDTVDLTRELKRKGYTDKDIRYVEVEDGQHNPQTWGTAMPDFLKWAFGR
jgi:enterochelin esterase-like enzyme